MAQPIVEGTISFSLPGSDTQSTTWYKVVGDIDKSPHPPLVVLHGGPGAGHEYLVSLTDLYEKYRIPLIFYDQVGCGRSTHFRDRVRDADFWTMDLFVKELDNLIDHLKIREKKGFYLLGQSWGGIFAGMYAARRPEGLKKLVLGGAPASFPLFVEGGRQLRAMLPENIRAVLEKGDGDGDYKTEEYEEASAYFYKQYVCRIDPMPEAVKQAFVNLEDDPTAYNTIQGPSEIVVDGSFKDWDGSEDAKNINVDTLLVNGKYDEVQEICVEPWFKSIPRVKWFVFENSSHMPHWEERDRFMELVSRFLLEY